MSMREQLQQREPGAVYMVYCHWQCCEVNNAWSGSGSPFRAHICITFSCIIRNISAPIMYHYMHLPSGSMLWTDFVGLNCFLRLEGIVKKIASARVRSYSGRLLWRTSNVTLVHSALYKIGTAFNLFLKINEANFVINNWLKWFFGC